MAVPGTIFFGLAGLPITASTAVPAASVVALVTPALAAVAFGLVYPLPKRAASTRQGHRPER